MNISNKIFVSDIEYIIIIATIIVSLLFSLKKNETQLKGNIDLDINFSLAIKGISCICILLAHYYTMQLSELSDSWSLSKIIGRFFANVALVLFMFLSGYGITKSEKKKQNSFKEYLKKRIVKVYYPLIFVCIIALIIYFIYPNKIPFTDIEKFMLPQHVFLLNDFKTEYIIPILKFAFGWIDWFVYCIIFFYLFFYIANKTSLYIKIHPSIILSLILLIYYIISFYCLGKEHAHFYRLTWAFLLGNIIACYKELEKKTSFIIILLSILTILNEDIYQKISFIIASFVLLFIFKIGKFYSIKGKLWILLGNISFFYYLCHIRITYVLLYYINVKSVIIWSLLNIFIAYSIHKLYNYIYRK